MKNVTKKKPRQKNNLNEIYVLLSKWETVEEYSEEEIEDLFDEYNIPEIAYIEKIDKPEEVILD